MHHECGSSTTNGQLRRRQSANRANADDNHKRYSSRGEKVTTSFIFTLLCMCYFVPNDHHRRTNPHHPNVLLRLQHHKRLDHRIPFLRLRNDHRYRSFIAPTPSSWAFRFFICCRKAPRPSLGLVSSQVHMDTDMYRVVRRRFCASFHGKASKLHTACRRNPHNRPPRCGSQTNRSPMNSKQP
ncbi:unnamed protein product [Ectocarpus fasciculatus]